jgi:AAA15 family ATPase/GTPase
LLEKEYIINVKGKPYGGNILINYVTISNFKILRNLENVPLGKITLIGGKNDIGKTTFLEALFLYLDFNTREVFENFLSWRMFNGIMVPMKVWEKFFADSDFSKEIIISVSNSKDEYSQVKVKFLENYETSVQFPVTENGITTIMKNFPSLEILHSSNESVDYQAHILCQGAAYNYIKEIDQIQNQESVFYIGERMRLYDRNPEYLGVLDKTDKQDKILPLLKIFEPNLVRLQLINENGINLIYADFGDKKKIPINMLGDGFCRCLTMALILATKETNVLLVDEVGSGIHYSVQDNLWDFLIKASELYDCQIIATTHCYDTIKAFNNAIEGKDTSNFSYIRLGKNKDEIKAFAFSSDVLRYSLSSELEIR